MSEKNTTILVEQLAESLLTANKNLAVAESCTGGWIAKVLTDMSGSSAWFERGFVTYSNMAKQEMLGVKAETIDKQGAVSQETAEQMAVGAIKNSRADYSLSVSGIAGPGGGSIDKPVGLVWFAWCKKLSANEQVIISSKQQNFMGDRNSIREQAVDYALSEVMKYIQR